MAFADHYSRSDFETMLSSDRGDSGSHDVAKAAIEAHLADVVAKGRLGRVHGIKGRRINVANAWNGLLGDPVHDFGWALINKLVGLPKRVALEMKFKRPDHDYDRPLDQAENAAAYGELCRMMDEGDLAIASRGHLLDELQDSVTGDTMRMVVAGWQPLLERMDRKVGYVWVPALDLKRPALTQVDLAMPTGQLLLTDWLHVKGMSKATDAIEEEMEQDISSATGQAEVAIAYAEQGGMGYAQTDNTSLSVFMRKDARAIAIYDSYDGKSDREIELDSDQWTRVGRICCDMWRVTAIDLAKAAEMAKNGGNRDATADIERHLALAAMPDAWTDGTAKEWRKWGMAAHSEQCQARNVTRLSIEPGIWRMRSGDGFSKRFRRRSIGLPKGGKLWCVLEYASPLNDRVGSDDTAVAA